MLAKYSKNSLASSADVKSGSVTISHKGTPLLL